MSVRKIVQILWYHLFSGFLKSSLTANWSSLRCGQNKIFEGFWETQQHISPLYRPETSAQSEEQTPRFLYLLWASEWLKSQCFHYRLCSYIYFRKIMKLRPDSYYIVIVIIYVFILYMADSGQPALSSRSNPKCCCTFSVQFWIWFELSTNVADCIIVHLQPGTMLKHEILRATWEKMCER